MSVWNLTKVTAALIDPDDSTRQIPDITVETAVTKGRRTVWVQCYPYDRAIITRVLGKPTDVRLAECALTNLRYLAPQSDDAFTTLADFRRALSGIYTFAWTVLWYANGEQPMRTLVVYPEGAALGIVVAAIDDAANEVLLQRLWAEKLVDERPLRYRTNPDKTIEMTVGLTAYASLHAKQSYDAIANIAFG
jgi:hypothetical protein